MRIDLALQNGALVFFLSVPQHRKSQRDLLLAILSITHSYKMQQEGESTKLCANGCGFFGSAASGGMCSVCWKKTMSNRQVETQSYTSTPVAAPVVEAAAAPSVDVDAPTPAEATPVEAPVVQKNKSRCWECKKKVGLTGIECRCGFVYCGSHRFADQHNCSYDFKSADRAELAKRNPGAKDGIVEVLFALALPLWTRQVSVGGLWRHAHSRSCPKKLHLVVRHRLGLSIHDVHLDWTPPLCIVTCMCHF
ncbi:hypothetical protein Ae201684_010846 [Aphanomyces euteiches]|uniref:AN1-type domain-containing protein n=1 Tax=Aphanomyces euteiches TaxID=100861 RepID=A0A6G0WWM2_9STRA|nr:hypothetical protein Ae201684_010846 [Aphanomyces euteiches]